MIGSNIKKAAGKAAIALLVVGFLAGYCLCR